VYIDFKLENSNNSSLTEPKLAVFQIFRPASKGGTLANKKKITKGGGGEKAGGKLQAMALAMKVGVPSSAFFCPTVFQSLQCESHSREPVGCGPSLAARPYPQLVSQLDNDQSPTITTFDVSRRWFVAVTASGTTWGLLGQPEAQAGKRKPPAAVEKKVEEDKGLSAYDQKILASVRRKEALRLSIEGQKAKGKSLASNP